MIDDFLAPGRLWLLLLVAGVAGAYAALQFARSRFTVRISSMELLDKVVPNRPGWRRHVVAGVYARPSSSGMRTSRTAATPVFSVPETSVSPH